ncbi:uncharacterized protein FIESC28_01485 [Fusarium coffeatum]|uniref:Uncharacterized protein n=1 Tax=Fusarium coffeatum TaxID=231269 RepID=A0A366S9S0_9HYPO|nr:uncharacterized protein FIESC28_01485 [Fusarium coffeatum]RBR25732.1 hypothetical protein FIESC28_01485 [Fusarium coffeatum]
MTALKDFTAALTALAFLSHAPLAYSQNTPNENLVLADCGIGLGVNGGSTSREAIYYNGDVWTGQGENTNKPTMMVNVPWTGNYPWGWVGFTMPNGDEWAVLNDLNVKDPNEAGIAHHSYEPTKDLTCYSYHRDRVFQLADGKWCSSAYVCNHRGRPDPNSSPEKPKPEPQKMEIRGSMNSDTVEFWNKPASHVMKTAKEAFLPDLFKCDTTKRQLNDKCTISWECSGDPVNKSLERMAAVFETLATHDKFTSEREVVTEVCRQPDTRPGKEGQCQRYEQKIDRYYKLPASMELTMRNIPRDGSGDNSNEHGNMKYTIECDTKKLDCVFCNLVGKALTIAVPAAGAAVSFSCRFC